MYLITAHAEHATLINVFTVEPERARQLKAADHAVFGVEALMLQGISPRRQRSVADALIRCAQNVESS